MAYKRSSNPAISELYRKAVSLVYNDKVPNRTKGTMINFQIAYKNENKRVPQRLIDSVNRAWEKYG